MTKRTLTRLLLKYQLERDVEPLYHEFGLREVHDVYWMHKKTIKLFKLKGMFPDYKNTRYRLKATWAQYCLMYKQETGKDHEDA